MSDKITLAPGQHTAGYDFQATSFAELGAKLDEFYASLDYSEVTASGSVSASVDISVLRSHGGTEPLRVSMGNYSATMDIYKRGY